MSGEGEPQQPVTITLSKEEAEQLRAFLTMLPRLNGLVNRLEALTSDGHMESLIMILSATKSMKEALNDEAVQSLAATTGKAVELLAALSHNSSKKVLTELSEHGEQLGELLAKISIMQREGVFESMSQAAYALKASMDALNEEAVANLASTLSDAATVWRTLSPLLGSTELASALNRVVKMEREGVLAAIEDVGYAVKSLKDSLNDEAMVNLATTVADALNIWRTLSPYVVGASKSPLPIIVQALTREGLIKQLEEAKPRSGISMLSPSDPDIRKGFGVLLEILKVIGSEFNKENAEKQS